MEFLIEGKKGREGQPARALGLDLLAVALKGAGGEQQAAAAGGRSSSRQQQQQQGGTGRRMGRSHR
jgi:hypothetical protein